MLLALVMALSLAACGGGKDKASGKKEITFWSIFTGGDGMAMDAIVNAYNATNPEYKVKHSA